MQIGIIGAGSMARALARGWGEPVLVSDPDRARAESLVAELGGEALESNAYVADRSNAVLLCHKPAQLAEVAEEIRRRTSAIISIVGATPLSALESAYPDLPVYRFMPNVAAEVRRGIFCYARGSLAERGPERQVRERFERLGVVLDVPDRLMEPATALMACGPAFFALVCEALADAGVRHGIEAEDAALMAAQTMAGTAALLAGDPTATRSITRRVTSPGGSTARGLAALERGGVRAAFNSAVDAVVGVGRR